MLSPGSPPVNTWWYQAREASAAYLPHPQTWRDSSGPLSGGVGEREEKQVKQAPPQPPPRQAAEMSHSYMTVPLWQDVD